MTLIQLLTLIRKIAENTTVDSDDKLTFLVDGTPASFKFLRYDSGAGTWTIELSEDQL